MESAEEGKNVVSRGRRGKTTERMSTGWGQSGTLVSSDTYTAD